MDRRFLRLVDRLWTDRFPPSHLLYPLTATKAQMSRHALMRSVQDLNRSYRLYCRLPILRHKKVNTEERGRIPTATLHSLCLTRWM